jgi:hypothetical protein
MSVSSSVPSKDSTDGTAGSAATYARSDHSHILNISTDLPKDLGDSTTIGNASVGTASTYARSDHVHSSNIKDHLKIVYGDNIVLTSFLNNNTNL